MKALAKKRWFQWFVGGACLLLVAGTAYALMIEGKSRNIADVTSGGYLLTNCVRTSKSAHTSLKHGELYSWATWYDAAASDYVIAIKNTDSTNDFEVTGIGMSSDVSSGVTIAFGTWSTVGGGAAITARNMNSGSGNVPDATAYRAATNLVIAGSAIMSFIIPANNYIRIPIEGKIVLAYGDTLFIQTDTASTTKSMWNIRGYYHD